MGSDFTAIFHGITTVLQPLPLLYLFLGFFIGIIFGALPGLTATLAIVLLLPMTYNLPMTLALVMCMGVYMAGTYSGSITAITINIPGAPASVMTAIEGNAMMKKGQGAKAIGYATISSAIGGTIGALLLILVSPYTLRVALHVRTPGKFSLILFAFTVIIVISNNKKKAAIMAIFGMMCATIGLDPLLDRPRYTFGINNLLEGVDLATLIIGAFAVSEIFEQSMINNAQYKKLMEKATSVKFKRRDFFPTFRELKDIGILFYLKNIIMGYFIGVLPGAGASMAAFVAYAEAKRTSKHPERFGTGWPEGICAPESANNAVCGGALVPMLSLGIPGDGVTAIILGVFMVYGIVPGPELLTKQIGTLGPMYMALLISALILMPLSLFLLGPYYVNIIKINRLILYSAIAIIALLGVYASNNNTFQIGVALVIGVLMFILKRQDYPTIPYILGVILGPSMEVYLRGGMQMTNGTPLIFVTQPDSITFLVLAILFAIMLPRMNKRAEDLEAQETAKRGISTSDNG
jgi:putative tricarboxylic transport membrane protein